MDFGDIPLWGGPLRDRGMVGTIAAARAVEITRTVVLEYFNQELLGHPSDVLNGRISVQGVSVMRWLLSPQ